MIAPASQTREEYKRYLALCQEYGSSPIRVADAFLNRGLPPDSQIDVRQSEVDFIYSGKPHIVKVTTLGKSRVKMVIGVHAVLENILINALSGNLTIIISPYCEVKNLVIQSFSADNVIHIGCGTKLNTANMLLQGAGRHIFIGHSCMFSTQLFIRTSDSHSMFSYVTGERINEDASVMIGDHVWVGRDVTINKGSRLNDDCIVGQASLVSGTLSSHCCMRGSQRKNFVKTLLGTARPLIS